MKMQARDSAKPVMLAQPAKRTRQLPVEHHDLPIGRHDRAGRYDIAEITFLRRRRRRGEIRADDIPHRRDVDFQIDRKLPKKHDSTGNEDDALQCREPAVRAAARQRRRRGMLITWWEREARSWSRPRLGRQ